VSLTRRVFAAQERRTVGEFGDSTPPPPGSMFMQGRSDASALQVMAVWGSVSVIAGTLSTLPWQLLSSMDPAKRRVLPLSPLLDRPYAEIYRVDWLKQYAVSMALWGEFFGHIISRDENLDPSQIKPISPTSARVRRLPDGTPEYRFNGKVVPVDNVLHIRNLSLAGALEGLKQVEILAPTFSLARAQDAYGAAYFANSSNPEGQILVEDELDPEETLKLARTWQAAHQGVGKAHMPAVLTGGAKFEAISINPKDSQFLESKQWLAGAIAGMIFRVPPHMLGIVDRTTSWGTGIEQQETQFVTNTLADYIAPLEEAMTRLSPNERYVKFDLSERLRGDKLQRYQAYALGTAGGWLCADDVLAAEDMPPLPNGQGKNYMVPINSELLAQALQSMKDSKDAAAQAALDSGQGGGSDG
jgi:HK97 family phage portal protein